MYGNVKLIYSATESGSERQNRLRQSRDRVYHSEARAAETSVRL